MIQFQIFYQNFKLNIQIQHMDPPHEQQIQEKVKNQQQIKQKVEQTKEQQKSQLKKGIIDEQKRKQMISEWINAKKQGNSKKLKYYDQLLKKHNFWDKQPTLRDDMKQIQHGNIQGLRKVEDVRKQRLQLPPGLFWCEIDVKDDKQLDELYTLLTNHYVEDDDNTFRFDYSHQFLRWALTPPGYLSKWHLGIRDQSLNNELVCSITGVPVHVAVENDKIKMCQINFLCVNKKYRSKNLASTLIAEVTRQVNLRNKWQAIYTSGTVLPTPFTQATYYHRSLNPKKLIQIGFSALKQTQTIPMVKKLYNLPEQPTLPLRPMVKKDIASVTKLINTNMEKYVVKFLYTEQQVKHYFMTKQNVVYSYVLQSLDPTTNKPRVTDFVSFYMLPSHVMKNPKHNRLNACYSFLNFATTVPYEKLILNVLILAKKMGCDVYNCLNLMENGSVFEQLHFQKGSGNLNYYLYNWIMKCKHINPQQLAIVLF